MKEFYKKHVLPKLLNREIQREKLDKYPEEYKPLNHTYNGVAVK